VPLFEEMDTLGLVDTYWAMILPQIASPIAMLVFKRFFDGIPRELEERALVDGASPWRVYWQIWMPLARPATGAVAIFTFVATWNNFIWPVVVTTALAADHPRRAVHGELVLRRAVRAGDGARDPRRAAPADRVPAFQRQIVQGISNTG
jgi:multiple sugar transport system permease protein